MTIKGNSFSSSGQNFPVPYGITDFVDPDNYKDGMFALVFSQFIERLARKVGFSWTGSDEELSAYSVALSNNALKIIQYDELKKTLEHIIVWLIKKSMVKMLQLEQNNTQ